VRSAARYPDYSTTLKSRFGSTLAGAALRWYQFTRLGERLLHRALIEDIDFEVMSS
jgi:hypothetical protein